MGYDICCIGHLTKDRVITSKATMHLPGGTSFYFSHALSHLDVSYLLVTALAETDMATVAQLQSKGIEVKVMPSAFTVFFENRYSEDQDQRTQRVLQQAAPFTPEQLSGLEAKIFHLGPLLADDIPVEVIKTLAAKGKVSLDVQGFLRKVEDENVLPVDWTTKKEALPFVHFLKANEEEVKQLTGDADIYQGARLLARWGVKEVIITLGSKGSVIFSESKFYPVPAFKPVRIEDATGCGDTYMAGYLYQRVKGASHGASGEFAAAMATLKIGHSGPFAGKKEEIEAVLKKNERLQTRTITIQ